MYVAERHDAFMHIDFSTKKLAWVVVERVPYDDRCEASIRESLDAMGVARVPECVVIGKGA